MGLIANYQLVNDQELEKIMDSDLDPEELLEDLEELAEEQEVGCTALCFNWCEFR